MKLVNKSLILFLGALVSGWVSAATLWQFSATNVVTHSSQKSAHPQTSAVALNMGVMTSLSVGDEVEIPISVTSTYTAHIKRVTVHENGDKTLYATLVESDTNSSLILTFGKSQFFARVLSPEGALSVTGNNAQGSIVRETNLMLNHQSQVDFLIPEPQLIPASENTAESLSLGDVPRSSVSSASIESLNTNSEIDVLFVYTADAEKQYGGNIQTRINHLVEVTNQIYRNSNVAITLSSVGIKKVEYSPYLLERSTLEDITNGVGVFSEIENLRFEKGADVVSFLRFIPNIFTNVTCGIAWLNGSDGSVLSRKRQMYSHVYANCPDYTLAHELGHNFGLAHSRRQSSKGGTFDYALGHGVDDQFVTVMAYQQEFNNAAKISRFSSPQLDCNGSACGVDKSDLVNGADAVFALNAVKHQVASFLSKNVNPTSLDDALLKVKDSALKQCIQSAVSGKNIKFSQQLTTLNCSRKNITSLAGLDEFSALQSVLLYDNSIVDISSLTKLHALSLLDLGANKVKNISYLSKLTNLKVLGLSGLSLKDISILQHLPQLQRVILASNEISNLAPLKGLNKLTDVNLSGNKLTDVSALFPLPLTKLSLAQNQDVFCWQVKHIANTRSISELSNLACSTSNDNHDFDGDGASNITEINNKTNPLNPDSDADGMTDGYEIRYGLNPNDASDAALDSDGDGFSNLQEFKAGTNPKLARENPDNPRKLIMSDFDADGKSDIIYRHKTDLTWRLDLMNESGIKQSSGVEGMSSCCGWLYNGNGDFNGDGHEDVIIRNISSGRWFIYNIKGNKLVNRGYVPIEDAVFVGVQAVADFDNDGKADVLLRNEKTGEWSINLLDNFKVKQKLAPPMSKVLSWKVIDAKDFDGNGSADILIRNQTSGQWYIYLYKDTTIFERRYIPQLPSNVNDIVHGVADFNSDGTNDLLMQNKVTKEWFILPLNGWNVGTKLSVNFASGWEFNAVGDFNGDGITDISVRNKNNDIGLAFWDGQKITSSQVIRASLTDGLEAKSLTAAGFKE